MSTLTDSSIALSGRVIALVSAFRTQFETGSAYLGTAEERTALTNAQADCTTLLAQASGSLATALTRLQAYLAYVAALIATKSVDTTSHPYLMTEAGVAIITEGGQQLDLG